MDTSRYDDDPQDPLEPPPRQSLWWQPRKPTSADFRRELRMSVDNWSFKIRFGLVVVAAVALIAWKLVAKML